jgi:regulator of RNase E activity RraA
MSTDLRERLARLPTAIVCDAYARTRLRPIEKIVIPGVLPVGLRTRAAGRARTQRMVIVRDRERSAMVNDRPLTFRLVEEAREGDFLVVTAPQGPAYAIFGGMLGIRASQRGVVGVIVDGATRDVAETDEVGLPVWARSVTPVPGGYAGYSVHELEVPVVCGGVEICTGDWILADADGALVIPAEDLEEILAVGEEMVAAEEGTLARLQEGASMDEAYPSRGYYADSSSGSPR